MKKILYGVQGTGNGHTTRARMMAKAFQQVDVEVDYFFSGRPHDKYFDMDVFRGYRIEEGVTLSYDRGKVSPFKTYMQADLTRLFRDIRSLDLSSYDLILNDFEPITAWAGRSQKKPVIAMCHQASFMHQAVPKSGGHFMTRQMIKWFAPADLYLGVHWYHFGGAIIPPFIEPYDATLPDQNSILVYLPFESLDDIVELLRCSVASKNADLFVTIRTRLTKKLIISSSEHHHVMHFSKH
ncbi:glycosyltransferase family protein [Algicola sagamiensis]|uniref:glycosyltransferase family protein n=1 Tax=Algicola sagamiensis TaxID=163869 RepID=UPI0003A570AB|nr:glycosyltransferase family protein [Algicola sagamiensis]